MIQPVNKNINNFSRFENFVPEIQLSPKFVDTLSLTKADFDWVKNPIITSALDELRHVVFDSKDVEYIKSLGLEVPFNSGEEAVNFIKKSNLRIGFADTGGDGIHAQYDYTENKILLNKKYQNTSDTADVLALAEAILHESGHAKDNDAESSVQEELNNLGMGALAHRFFEKKYPQIFNNVNTLIVNDGVNVYARIFFDADSNKKALIQRVKQKYGLLPAGDKMHTASPLALKIKN